VGGVVNLELTCHPMMIRMSALMVALSLRGGTCERREEGGDEDNSDNEEDKDKDEDNLLAECLWSLAMEVMAAMGDGNGGNHF
jgi:hypothetical protein